MLREHRVLKDNLLEELNQFVGKVGAHEGLNGNGDVFGVLSLVERRLDDLINELATILVTLVKDCGPEVSVLTMDEVTRLSFKERVLIANLEREKEYNNNNNNNNNNRHAWQCCLSYKMYSKKN